MRGTNVAEEGQKRSIGRRPPFLQRPQSNHPRARPASAGSCDRFRPSRSRASGQVSGIVAPPPPLGYLQAPMKESRAGARVSHLALLLGLATLAACPSAPIATPPPPEPEVELAAPSWIHEPLSWHKLETIEAWLETDAPRHDPGLVVEAELLLNEGRIDFLRRDLESGSVPKDTLEVRADTANKGFQHVLDNPVATTGQRNRAQIGQRAVAALLAKPGKPQVAIVPRAQWGARAPRLAKLDALKGDWSRITIHHSAETSSDPIGGSFEDSAQTLRLIQKFHMDDPGHLWGDIGYHFLIDSAGRIFQGRELKWQGAHAGGDNNFQNIGICLLGDLERRPPTPAALKSLETLLGHLRSKHKIPVSRVYSHDHFKVTDCPGPALKSWLAKYGRG